MFVTFKAFLKFPDEWPTDAVYLKRFDMEEPKGTEPGLYALVTSRENWLRDRPRYAALGTIRDEVPMSMQEVKVADLLRARPSGKIEFIRIGSRGFSPTLLSEVPRGISEGLPTGLPCDRRARCWRVTR